MTENQRIRIERAGYCKTGPVLSQDRSQAILQQGHHMRSFASASSMALALD
jgi:hypothetical protein